MLTLWSRIPVPPTPISKGLLEGLCQRELSRRLRLVLRVVRLELMLKRESGKGILQAGGLKCRKQRLGTLGLGAQEGACPESYTYRQ